MDSATNRGNIFSRSRMLPVKGAGNRPMLLIGLNRAEDEARLSKIARPRGTRPMLNDGRRDTGRRQRYRPRR